MAIGRLGDGLSDGLACCRILVEECARYVCASRHGRGGDVHLFAFHVSQRIVHTLDHGGGRGAAGL